MNIIFEKAAQSLKRDWFAHMLIGMAMLIQLVLVFQPLQYLIANILPDDAFYYFQIARTIVQDHGVRFDGVEMTNGFHPLWMLVLVPIFEYFSVGGVNDLVPIHMALLVCVACSAIAAWCVNSILARVTKNTYARLAGLALWLFNPFLLFESINGLETALTLALTTSFILAALTVGEKGTRLQYIGLGVLAGLMVLARLDMIFYLVAYGAWILPRVWKESEMRERVLWGGGIAVLLVSGWVVWNWLVFHMLLTSASNGFSMVTRELIMQDNGTGLLVWVKAIMYNIDYQVRLLFLHTGSPAMLCALIGAGTALLYTKALHLPKRLKDITLLQAFFVGFLLLFFANVVLRFGGRSWYFVTFGLFVSLLAALVASHLPPTTRIQKWCAGGVALFVLFAFGVSWSKEIRNQYAAAPEMYAAALWANEHLPRTAIVGAFNTGIQAYFGTHRTVNLDGLVNNSAYTAMHERRLWAYMQEIGLTHVIDFPIYITYRYRGFFGTPDVLEKLTPLGSISLGGHSRSSDGIHMYAMPVFNLR